MRKNVRHIRKLGFTLIELLVVASIISLISSMILAALSSARGKARDAKRVRDLQQLRTALELYYTDFRTYPIVKDLSGQQAGSDWQAACNSFEYDPAQPNANCWNGTHADSLATKLSAYLKPIPLPPSNGAYWPGCNNNGRISVYVYYANATASEYKLGTYMEVPPCLPVVTQDGGTDPNLFELFSPGGRAF